MSKLKTTGIILLITLLLIAALNLLAGLFVDKVLEQRKSYTHSTRGNNRYRLPNYKNTSWAEKHFQEFDSLASTYSSYVGWRRKPYTGKTIIIDENGFRINPESSHCNNKKSIWFFGGSTMWGTGSSSQYTIPAYFEHLNPAYCSKNFGESAWRSRQELALLINRLHLEKKKPEVVVFYDGVNDFYNGVLQESTDMTHSYEKNIQKQMDLAEKGLFYRLLNAAGKGLTDTFVNNFIRLINFSKKKMAADSNKAKTAPPTSTLSKETGASSKADSKIINELFAPCELSESRKKLIDKCVEEQLYVYSVVNDICNKQGVRFIALLQPILWAGSPYRNHLLQELESSPECAPSLYAYYYNEIVKKAAGRDYFHDLTHAFDSDWPIYIDFCHVSPNGNKIIAEKIAKIIAK
ncbi:SGNH/GDSL hydrolase family protein [Desulfovibrio sp. JC010]|uniref:SGNH/GDSL hydrolase family protein n=1 Tax=Desulfovibrio sp. JC010 TaxID=2593641 RepID=UPI0013D12CC6|nr:SGNH/GDSL hydrolase family protein [Desulfovibrio sp. JC010]NDV27817.1 SGNH/GDSL hydrolase family protein [Desulfovibrio sp. JC010]